MAVDKDGNVWLGMMNQTGAAKFDRKTEKFTFYPIPKEMLDEETQTAMVAPIYSHVDGKVWFSEGGTRTFYRLERLYSDAPRVDLALRLDIAFVAVVVGEIGRDLAEAPVGVVGRACELLQDLIGPRVEGRGLAVQMNLAQNDWRRHDGEVDGSGGSRRGAGVCNGLDGGFDSLGGEDLFEGGAHLFHEPAVGRHLAVIERDKVMDLCIQILTGTERQVRQMDRGQSCRRRELVAEVAACELKGNVVEDAGIEQDPGVVFHGIDCE